MDWITALILGLIQGLTEFLPVSSSGHLELGKAIFGVEAEESLSFTVAVHGATVLSTIVVFYGELARITKKSFTFSWNEEKQYVIKILLSLVPVGIVGVFFKSEIEQFFTGDIRFVGAMLIITALLLGSTHLVKPGIKRIPYISAFIIGISQALAVLPGISRSGATISTGLLLGNQKEEVTRFSFLMVLLPIIGANLVDVFSGEMTSNTTISIGSLIIGFLAAFISGYFACKWMIKIVSRGKLIYFAIYCLIIGIISIIVSF